MFKSGSGVTYEAVIIQSPTLCRTQKLADEDHDEQDSTTPVSVETTGQGFFGRGDRRTDNSIVMTVIVTLNYMIGSGILNAPQIFRESGVAAASVLFLLACEWLDS